MVIHTNRRSAAQYVRRYDGPFASEIETTVLGARDGILDQ